MARAPRKQRVHSRNVVVDVGGETRLWSFQGADARPAGSVEQPADWPLPPKLVSKSWAQLARKRVNIAWLADQPVFIQLVHLPTDDPSEVPAMLELQLEKISPLPVGQIVWSFEILPQRASTGIAVLVLVAERPMVEKVLADLERRGFQTDRIESPLLPLVSGANYSEDGAYVFLFRSGARRVCLIGWASDGVLRALNVVNLAEDDRWVRQLVDELNRLTWAGELQGWATHRPSLHLVADEETLSAWREPLEKATGIPVTAHVRPSDPELAAASARRAAEPDAGANLLPDEHRQRYRQEFTDRLWMGGLGAVVAAYLVGVLIYFGLLQYQRHRHTKASEALATVNQSYTNTLRLKAQAQVLQETVNLRYAALDSWMATVEAMPEELSLESLVFSGGQSVVISGFAPADQHEKITEFARALQRKMVGGKPLFDDVLIRPTVARTVGGAQQIQWSFTCRLQRTEI
jgi:hypothetical protein